MKNTLEGINSQSDEAGGQIRDLVKKMAETLVFPLTSFITLGTQTGFEMGGAQWASSVSHNSCV